MYFTKDFINVNPATHNDKPVVGIAIGEKEEELEFAKQALKLGVSIIVVDSSHADCSEIINQCKKLVKLVDGQAAVIAGNYANIKGYLDLARTGVDAVKLGIGSGAICTTTQGTGIGKPMFTAIQESDFVRRDRQSKNKHAPVIIADGGINGSGQMLIALAAGAGACMAGKWLVPADESLSSKKNWKTY